MRRLLSYVMIAFVGIGVAYAQQKSVSGKVTSADGKETLPGVNVFVKESPSTGTITDINGAYELKQLPVNAKTLVFSFIGMNSVELPITGSKVNAMMESASQQLDEVMIVAYGTVKKGTYTGSANVVKSDALTSAKVESIDKALSGKVAGVRVASTTGAPGASGEIQIRGIGSINGSTAPLYVIDGIPITNANYNIYSSNSTLSGINPEDIESMTILKDAAASSLYGSRAANGVVIITTKKGKSGETTFSAKATYGITSIASNSYEMMSGDGYASYAFEALKNGYLAKNNGLVPGSANYGSQSLLTAAEDYARANLVSKGKVVEGGNNTNWRNDIFDTGHNQEYQVSMRGGSDKNQFYSSIGYNEIKGIVSNDEFERLTGTLNFSNQAKSWLKFDLNNLLSYTATEGGRDKSAQAQGVSTTSPIGVLMQMNPTAPSSINGEINKSASFSRNIGHPDLVLGGDKEWVKTQNYRILTQGTATADITSYLKFKSANSIDLVNFRSFEYWSPSSVNGSSLNGLGDKRHNIVTTFTTSNSLNFNKTFKDNHSLDAVAAFEVQSEKRDYLIATANNYSTDKLPELSVGQARNAASYIYKDFMRSFIGGANYSYKNKYFISGSIRADESSKLGQENRLGVFWSASASWRFTNEEFFESSIITDGKVRVSYGTNGTLPGDRYGHLGLYTFGGIYGDQSAIYLAQAANPNLGWEKSNNLNVGADITLSSRFMFTAEYFNKYTKDLLMMVPTSSLTGFTSTLQNNGEISNKGFEFEFNGKDLLKSRNFKWDISFNLNTLKAKVEKLPNGKDVLQGDGDIYIYREGEDLYSFYFPIWHGVDPESGLAQFVKDPSKPATPDNLTYYQSEAGRTLVAKAYPDLMGGLTNSFEYKNFTLNFLVTYQFGGNIFDYPGYFMNSYGFRLGAFNASKDYEDNYWKASGDNAKYPKPVSNDWNGRPDLWSSKNVVSSDFIRFKEITLGYNLPKRFAEKLKMNSINVSVTGNNLFFLYRATKTLDPEVALNGYRTTDTPLTRVCSFGIQLGF